eukprot:227243-Chlamydomonas_euryale.AAC.5
MAAAAAAAAAAAPAAPVAAAWRRGVQCPLVGLAVGCLGDRLCRRQAGGMAAAASAVDSGATAVGDGLQLPLEYPQVTFGVGTVVVAQSLGHAPAWAYQPSCLALPSATAAHR